MHDGRFATLEEVIEYYDHRIESSAAFESSDLRFTPPKAKSPKVGDTPMRDLAMVEKGLAAFSVAR